MSCLYILEINPLSVTLFANIFSHSVGCLFILFMALLGIYLEKNMVRKNTRTPMFIAALFAMAKTWKPPKCPSTEEWIKKMWGFPGGAAVENLPANAGDTGSSPGLGRSHMPRSGWAREPQLLSLRVWSLCSATRDRDGERPAHRDEEWPPLAATTESPRTETKTQHSQK